LARWPWADGYGTVTIHTRGDSLTPESFPDLTIAVDDVLG
jgi:hypothetical protein